jgi:hypothetical protein
VMVSSFDDPSCTHVPLMYRFSMPVSSTISKVPSGAKINPMPAAIMVMTSDQVRIRTHSGFALSLLRNLLNTVSDLCTEQLLSPFNCYEHIVRTT